MTSAGRGDISTLMRGALVKLSLKAGRLHSRRKEGEEQGWHLKPRGKRLEHLGRCGLWLVGNFGCFGEGKALEMFRESLQEAVDCVLLCRGVVGAFYLYCMAWYSHDLYGLDKVSLVFP